MEKVQNTTILETIKEDQIKHIEVKVKHIDTGDNKFDAYKAVQKSGKYIDLKFIRAVKNLPKQDCILVIKASNLNIDKNRKYPVLWCKAIEEILPIEKAETVDTDVNEMF